MIKVRPSAAVTGDKLVQRLATELLWRDVNAGWQPIETAPRDGTVFLAVRLEEDGTPTYNVVFYDSDNANRDFIWGLVEGAFYHKDWPNHWMPLPPPPRDRE